MPDLPAVLRLSFEVSEAEAGERLDRILADRSGLARSRLVVEQVQVDGSPARLKDRPIPGASVDAAVLAPPPARLVPAEVTFEVVWEDADLLVVDKPPGLAVHAPAGGTSGERTLVAGLLARYPEIEALAGPEAAERPGIVHRLDKDTSGLLVVARSDRALSALRGIVARRDMQREYAALVAGRFAAPSGEIDAPIGRRPGARRMSVREGGRDARTRYEVVTAWDRPSLSALCVWLDTGRTHQIRVHLGAIGHPVVGDRTYRGPVILGAQRQFLHAHRLTFAHPFSGKHLDVVAALPSDLRAVLAAAGPPSEGEVPAPWIAAS